MSDTTAKTSPIFEIKAFRKGVYEIEGSFPVDAESGIEPTFSAIVPYWVPIKPYGLDPRTPSGRREMADLQMAGFKFSPLPSSKTEEIGFREDLMFTIENVKTIEEAFEKLLKELPRRREEDFKAKLKKRLEGTGPQVRLATTYEVRKFG